MNRPGFAEGVGVALAGCVLTGVAWTVLGSLLPFALLARLLVDGLAGGYLLYLLARARVRVGRVTVVAGWLAGTALLLVLDAPFALHVLAQAGVTWLVRACVYQRGPLAAAADLGLVAAGVLAAGWAMVETGSAALAAWCLLLAQAPFAALSARPPAADRQPPSRADDPFERAHRAAESALARLAAQR